jgi:DNA repair exonuclease SbcCD ATPase subunit
MKERVRRIEGQLAESEEEGTRLQEKILILEEEVSKLQADNMELQLQLELERNNEAKLEEDWINERAEWEARVAHLETELNLASCTNGELDFLITPMKGASDRTLGSPRTPTGHFSIRTLLDLGEASLEVEGDFHELRLKHADAEVQVQSATFELQKKEHQMVELRGIVSQMKVELAAEKEKAKEEAEDLTQEMAELRYQLMEMVEQERELRAQVEQASVLRVEELEAQVKDARKEVLHSLVRRREAEENAEGCTLEFQHLQLANEVI